MRAGAMNDGPRRAAGEIGLSLLPATGAAALAFAHFLVPVVALTAAVVVTALSVEAMRGMRLMRHGRAAVASLEGDPGARDPGGDAGDVGQRLEMLAAAIVGRRAGDVESKRVLAHELKTPLSAMRNLSQLLTGFDLTSAERHRVATLLGDETEKLQEMITRLLEIEQLALRDRTAAAATVDLGELVPARAAFLARGLSRAIEVTALPHVLIQGDAALLERVVDNLVGNAVKYSPPPRPVSVHVGRDGASAVVEVMDRGAGVRESERQRIFMSFTRGLAAAGTEGLGLGLALVAEAVRWHGGTIEVLDRDGGGSVFRVRLPAAPDGKEAA
jgi:signal transduction histidine kinase